MNENSNSKNLDNFDYTNPWCLDDFQIGKKLGGGRFGTVFLTREKRTKLNLLFAIKVLSKDFLVKNNSTNNFKCEVQNHLKLK